jgi:hypothetical protein
MAIILRSQLDGKRYMLVGTGYGETESASRASFYASPDIHRYSTQWACVCDASGKLSWIPTQAVVVEEVDGLPVTAWSLDVREEASELPPAPPVPAE